MNIESCPTPTAASALRGEEAEGRDVERVAEAEESEAANVCLAANVKRNTRAQPIKATFLRLNEYNKCILKNILPSLKTECFTVVNKVTLPMVEEPVVMHFLFPS